MIEVQPDPKNAAVDPLQPLSFNQFEDMMTKIKILAKFEGGVYKCHIIQQF